MDILGRFAPGTDLRAAVDLIIHQGNGALIAIGTSGLVESLSSGGFSVSAARFTPQRVAELAKMDGGIVVDDEAEFILRANVHFIPDPSLETGETGTRHRTAERLARQTGKPVIAVSEGRAMAIVYHNQRRFELQPPTELLAEANQSLNALERLRRRLTEAENNLTGYEVHDVVVVRDVALVLQRATLVRRLSTELEQLMVAMGGEAQLIRLQAADFLEGVDDLITFVYFDYVKRRPKRPERILELLDDMPGEQLYDLANIAAALNLSHLDSPVRPRGLRILSKVPRLPDPVREALVSHFGDFQKLLNAEVSSLDQVEGVGRKRAMQLRNYFDRLADFSSVVELG